MVDTNFVEEILQQAREKESEALKTVEVIKNVDLQFDLGHLLVTDTNELDVKAMRENTNDYLKNLARDDVQLFINQMWSLPTNRVDNIVVAQLPAPVTKIPRALPLPKPKTPTKWESYAKEKGINKRVKEKLVFDEVTKLWKPRYGFNRINAPKDDWVMEVPDNNDDPEYDGFEKKREEKKERIAKNEFQRLRNVARTNKIKIVNNAAGIVPALAPTKDREEVAKAVSLAKASTASMGKFEQKVRNEKAPKDSGKRRKFEPNSGDMDSEKQKSLDLLNKMNKVPKLDVKKAVSAFMNKEQKEQAWENAKGGKKGKGKKMRPKREYQGKNFKGKTKGKRPTKPRSS